MASRSEIARQDQATEQRRADACAVIADALQGKDTYPEIARDIAASVLDALIEAIEGERDDITELRRKGWQTKAREQDAALLAVKEWRDDLVAYTPPRPLEGPKVTDTTDAQGIPVSARADSPADLEARLTQAFGPNLAPVRHIRTVVEPDDPNTTDPQPRYGRLCGGTDGSFTTPSAANCETCHAVYAEQNGGKPYDGPKAFNSGDPLPTDPPTMFGVPVVVEPRMPADVVAVVSPEDAAVVEAPQRRDGQVTPAVAAEIRAEVEREGGGPLNMRIVGGPVAREMPTTAGPMTINPTGPTPEYAVGDSPFGAGGNILNPDNEQGVSLAEFVFGSAESAAMAAGLDRAAQSAVNALPPPMPTVVEPPARPTTRERMTAAQVREHGLARQRGQHHRSVSQVSGFADCGTRAALSDLERPAWWNVGGKAFHACAEEINHTVANGGDLPRPSEVTTGPIHAYLETLWLRHFDAQIVEQAAATPEHAMDTWRAANKGSEHYDWWRVEGPAMVSRYVVWLASMLRDGWSIATATHNGSTHIGTERRPVIEFETQLDVGLSVPNLSIIDLALINDESQAILVVDFKAGGSAPKDTFQLGVYGWCLLSAGVASHPSQVRGAYYRARKGELTPAWPVLDMHPWPDVVQRYRDMDTMERQGIYMPNVANFCGGCGVRDLCPALATAPNVQ